MMIRKFIIYMTIALAAVITVSCNDYDIGEVLLVYDDISLTVKGELQYKYNPLNHQYGYDLTTGEFRAYDDKLSDWFVIRCSSVPIEAGEIIVADIEYTAQNTTRKFENLQFFVKKMSSEGYVWLWNDSRKIGAVVRLER